MTKSENEKKNIFHCKKCDYTCYKKSIFDKHLLTLKHKNRTIRTKKTVKNPVLEHYGKGTKNH